MRIATLYMTKVVVRINEIMPFAATWMEPEIIMLSEISHKEKNKCHVISLIYRI